MAKTVWDNPAAHAAFQRWLAQQKETRMMRFKPYANSSATRTVFTMGREVGAWPCGCTVDCDYESMTLRTCNKDDCIRDAETPWTPPALRQPSTFRCTKCSWRGLLSETGGWVPAGGNCDEGEDVCPECRADIAIVPRDGQARFCNLSMVGFAHNADDSRFDLFYFNCGCSLEVNREWRTASWTEILGAGVVAQKTTHDRVAKLCSGYHAAELTRALTGNDSLTPDPYHPYDKVHFVA